MLLFVILLTVLVARQMLWTAPLIIALWANCHGAFPIGVVLIGCFAVARRRWEECAILCVAMLATLVNPYGWHVYEYVRTTSSRATRRVIQEWLRPDVFSFHGAFWLATILVVAGLVVWQIRLCIRWGGHSCPLRDAVLRGPYGSTSTSLRGGQECPPHQDKFWMPILFVTFAVISCTSIRMNIWWYLVAAPIAMALWPRSERPAVEPSPIATAFYGVVLLMMAVCLPSWQTLNPVFTMRPADRTEDRLQQLLPQIPAGARVFCRLEWGEYFSFSLPWQHSIFMDGRIEIYDDAIWDEYRRISSAEPDWQELLDRHGVNVLVLDTTYHAGLIDRMKNNPAWRLAGSAGTGEMYVRNAQVQDFIKQSAPDVR
jgi:hypothetical protein